MLVSSLAKSKRLQILPGYSSTYDPSSPLLKIGKPKVLIIEVKSFKMSTTLIISRKGAFPTDLKKCLCFQIYLNGNL